MQSYELSQKTADALEKLLGVGLPSDPAKIGYNNAERFDTFVLVNDVADELGYYPCVCTEWDTDTGTWQDYSEEVWVFPANDIYTLTVGNRYRALCFGGTPDDSGDDVLVFVVDTTVALPTGCHITTSVDDSGHEQLAVDPFTLAGTGLTTEIIPDEDQADSDSEDGPCYRLAVDVGSLIDDCTMKVIPGDDSASPPTHDTIGVNVDMFVGSGWDITRRDPDHVPPILCDTVALDCVNPALFTAEGLRTRLVPDSHQADSDSESGPCRELYFPLDPKTDTTIKFISSRFMQFEVKGCNLALVGYKDEFTFSANEHGVIVKILNGPAPVTRATLATIPVSELLSVCGYECDCDPDSDSEDSDSGDCFTIGCDEYTIQTFIPTPWAFGYADGAMTITVTRYCGIEDMADTAGYWIGTDDLGAVWGLYNVGTQWGVVFDMPGIPFEEVCGQCQYRYDSTIDDIGEGECFNATPTTCCPGVSVEEPPWGYVTVCCGEPKTYDCVDNVCVEAVGDTGEFASLAECEDNCGDDDSSDDSDSSTDWSGPCHCVDGVNSTDAPAPGIRCYQITDWDHYSQAGNINDLHCYGAGDTYPNLLPAYAVPVFIANPCIYAASGGFTDMHLTGWVIYAGGSMPIYEAPASWDGRGCQVFTWRLGTFTTIGSYPPTITVCECS